MLKHKETPTLGEHGGNRITTKLTPNSLAETAYDRVVNALKERGSKTRPNRNGVMAQCPAHEDNTPSLAVTDGADAALVHCHAGCHTEDVLAALNLDYRDLWDNPRGTYNSPHVIYRYDDGLIVRRLANKEFPVANHKKPSTLYRLGEVKQAVSNGQTIYLVEGEKDANNLTKLMGVIATTAPQGAGNISYCDLTPLHGSKVIAVVDKDTQGQQWANQVHTALDGHVQSLEFKQAKIGEDSSDHLAAGLTLEDLENYPHPLETLDPPGDTNTLDETRLERFNHDVSEETYRLMVRQAARQQLEQQAATAIELPPLQELTGFLATPDEPVTYRVDDLLPIGGRALLTAQHKAGKTTLTANLIRSLVDGDRFLGEFTTTPVNRVVLIDNELDPRMLRRWLRDQHITNTDAVTVLPLRGHLSTFNITDPDTRTRWANHLKGGDVVIFDCLRPALDALGLDENRDAGQFLEAFDELITSAGINEAVLVHHMGHGGERSRGDSRILDWPDAVWKLIKDGDDPDSPRFFSAYGRDVEVGETRLEYNHETRGLTLGGGSRKDHKASKALVEDRQLILSILSQQVEGLSGNELATLANRKDRAFTTARNALVSSGEVVTKPRAGRGAGRLYLLSEGTYRTYREPTDPVSTELTEPPLKGSSGSSVGKFANIPKSSSSTHPHSEPADTAEPAEPAEAKTVDCHIHPHVPHAEPGRCIPCEVEGGAQ